MKTIHAIDTVFDGKFFKPMDLTYSQKKTKAGQTTADSKPKAKSTSQPSYTEATTLPTYIQVTIKSLHTLSALKETPENRDQARQLLTQLNKESMPAPAKSSKTNFYAQTMMLDTSLSNFHMSVYRNATTGNIAHIKFPNWKNPILFAITDGSELASQTTASRFKP